MQTITSLDPSSSLVRRPITLQAISPSLADALRFVGVIYVISRVVLIATTVLVYFHPPVGFRGRYLPLWWVLHRWDANWYTAIAKHGYSPLHAHDAPAFFPLYPLIEHVLAPVTGGQYYFAGLLSANVAWFFALLALYLLAQQDFGTRAAQGAVIAIAAFPTSFYSFVPYPEAIFLALAIGSFWQMRQGRWALAGLLGLLAALTRQGGVLLIVPFVWEYAAQHGLIVVRWRLAVRSRFAQPVADAVYRALWLRLPVIHLDVAAFRRAVRLDVVFALAFPAGTALYCLWLWHIMGDPLAFQHAEAHWYRATMWPWQTISNGFADLARETDPFLIFRSWQEIIPVFGVGAVLVWRIRRMPVSYVVLAVPMYLLFLSNSLNHGGWAMSSQARYMLEIFPVFIVIGDLMMRHRWSLIAFCLIGIPVQLILMGGFVLGLWII